MQKSEMVYDSNLLKIRSFWVDRPFETGIPLIDLQHIYLMNLLLEFHGVLDADNKPDSGEISKSYSKILDFVSEHFYLEAQMLSILKFPGYTEHIKEHNHFVNEILRKSPVEMTGDPDAAKQVLSDLMSWLYKHTLQKDLEYAEWFRTQGNTAQQLTQKLAEQGEIYISDSQIHLYRMITDRNIVLERSDNDIIHKIHHTWKSYDLSLRIPLLDMQHLWFIYIALKLEAESRSYNDRTERFKAFHTNLTEIKKYTVTHFSTEEKLMKMFDYPGLRSHQEQHKHFVNSAKVRVGKITAENAETGILLEQAGFMKNWLLSHIAVQDKSLLWFFRKEKEKVQLASKQLIRNGDASLKRKQINLYKRITEMSGRHFAD
jgi:hemerythrin-like metal-binding protein